MAKTIHKKSLGQNFLHDESVIDAIVDVAQITPGESIIEVGPGEGVLTEKLLSAAARVFAVEIDRALIPALEKRFGNHVQCTILNEDIRRFHIPAFLAQQNITTYKVVANLPYYITSSIIRIFLESVTQPKEMVIMVQKEVAERICASPGAMSILAVSVQYYGVPEILFDVPAEAFDPVPQVDSAVIRITDIKKPLLPQEEKQFFRTIKAGFSARRKTLANNIANSFGREKKDIEALLHKQGHKPTVRAQELSVAQWESFASVLVDK